MYELYIYRHKHLVLTLADDIDVCGGVGVCACVYVCVAMVIFGLHVGVWMYTCAGVCDISVGVGV